MKSILILEPDLIFKRFFQDALKKYKLYFAKDVYAVEEIIKTRKFDLFIINASFGPDSADSFWLIKKIKKQTSPPIIATCANKEGRRRFTEEGCLTSTKSEILKTVESVLSLS